MTRTDILNLSFGALAAAVVALAAATPARSATCAPRDAILERLAQQFGETRRGLGLGTRNRVVEVFASPETGSWTITVTLPDGRTCLIASGQDWEEQAPDLSHLQDADA